MEIINGVAYYGNTENEIKDNQKEFLNGVDKIVIGEKVSVIESSAFENCENIKEVEISSGVYEIGNSAFQGCTLLEKVKFIDNHSLSSIEAGVFNDCKKLKSINIPDTVEKIERKAFSNNNTLEIIKIPNSVSSIDESAFDNCNELKIVTIKEVNVDAKEYVDETYDKISGAILCSKEELMSMEVKETLLNDVLSRNEIEPSEEEKKIDNNNDNNKVTDDVNITTKDNAPVLNSDVISKNDEDNKDSDIDIASKSLYEIACDVLGINKEDPSIKRFDFKSKEVADDTEIKFARDENGEIYPICVGKFTDENGEHIFVGNAEPYENFKGEVEMNKSQINVHWLGGGPEIEKLPVYMTRQDNEGNFKITIDNKSDEFKSIKADLNINIDKEGLLLHIKRQDIVNVCDDKVQNILDIKENINELGTKLDICKNNIAYEIKEYIDGPDKAINMENTKSNSSNLLAIDKLKTECDNVVNTINDCSQYKIPLASDLTNQLFSVYRVGSITDEKSINGVSFVIGEYIEQIEKVGKTSDEIEKLNDKIEKICEKQIDSDGNTIKDGITLLAQDGIDRYNNTIKDVMSNHQDTSIFGLSIESDGKIYNKFGYDCNGNWKEEYTKVSMDSIHFREDNFDAGYNGITNISNVLFGESDEEKYKEQYKDIKYFATTVDTSSRIEKEFCETYIEKGFSREDILNKISEIKKECFSNELSTITMPDYISCQKQYLGKLVNEIDNAKGIIREDNNDIEKTKDSFKNKMAKSNATISAVIDERTHKLGRSLSRNDIGILLMNVAKNITGFLGNVDKVEERKVNGKEFAAVKYSVADTLLSVYQILQTPGGALVNTLMVEAIYYICEHSLDLVLRELIDNEVPKDVVADIKAVEINDIPVIQEETDDNDKIENNDIKKETETSLELDNNSKDETEKNNEETKSSKDIDIEFIEIEQDNDSIEYDEEVANELDTLVDIISPKDNIDTNKTYKDNDIDNETNNNIETKDIIQTVDKNNNDIENDKKDNIEKGDEKSEEKSDIDKNNKEKDNTEKVEKNEYSKDETEKIDNDKKEDKEKVENNKDSTSKIEKEEKDTKIDKLDKNDENIEKVENEVKQDYLNDYTAISEGSQNISDSLFMKSDNKEETLYQIGACASETDDIETAANITIELCANKEEYKDETIETTLEKINEAVVDSKQEELYNKVCDLLDEGYDAVLTKDRDNNTGDLMFSFKLEDDVITVVFDDNNNPYATLCNGLETDLFENNKFDNIISEVSDSMNDIIKTSVDNNIEAKIDDFVDNKMKDSIESMLLDKIEINNMNSFKEGLVDLLQSTKEHLPELFTTVREIANFASDPTEYSKEFLITKLDDYFDKLDINIPIKEIIDFVSDPDKFAKDVIKHIAKDFVVDKVDDYLANELDMDLSLKELSDNIRNDIFDNINDLVNNMFNNSIAETTSDVLSDEIINDVINDVSKEAVEGAVESVVEEEMAEVVAALL